MARNPHNTSNLAVIADEAARCYELRLKGLSQHEIAQETGIAQQRVSERIAQFAAQRLDPMVDEYRQIELDRLEDLERRVRETLEVQSVVVSYGKVMYVGDHPLVDTAPVLAAVAALIRIAERRAKLLGLDAPVKAHVSGTLTYEIVGVDMGAV